VGAKDSTAWSKVVGRKERRREAQRNALAPPTAAKPSGRGGLAIKKRVLPLPQQQPQKGPKRQQQQQQKQPSKQQQQLQGAAARKKAARRKVPRSEAVVVTCPVDTYANVMSRAKKQIDLKALDIDNIRVKCAVTGDNKVAKADVLAAALRGFIPQEEARIARPHKTGDLRLHGINEATTANEVAEAVAKTGVCATTEVKVGQLRLAPSGMYSVWVQCPPIRWRRPIESGWGGWWPEPPSSPSDPQCFRCLKRGHVREGCTSQVDQTEVCY
jgi:hypothetical protein